jgi:hypothetical protein
MAKYSKEYFNDYCYFLLESNGNDFFLNYSLYNVILESKNSKCKKRIKKENLKNIEKKIQSILKKNKKVTKSEIDELVDSDGTMLSSKVPFLDMTLHPKKTMDQTIDNTRTPGLTFTYGGGRRMYGENIQNEDDVLDESDMTDNFGYKETEFKDLKDTKKTLDKMGIKDPINKLERAKKFGKRNDTKVVKNKKGQTIIKNLNLFEKETLDEIKKQKMIKMVEDILSKKEKGESDVIPKDSPISKLLVKNLESIKRLADKEGISINKLINILKKSE